MPEGEDTRTEKNVASLSVTKTDILIAAMTGGASGLALLMTTPNLLTAVLQNRVGFARALHALFAVHCERHLL